MKWGTYFYDPKTDEWLRASDHWEQFQQVLWNHTVNESKIVPNAIGPLDAANKWAEQEKQNE